MTELKEEMRAVARGERIHWVPWICILCLMRTRVLLMERRGL